MLIRIAEVHEAEVLSQLAVRSKAHWGYSSSFLEACRDELEVTPRQIEGQRVFVLMSGERLAGFYSLEHLSDGRVELDALFVEPELIGSGFGRALFEHASREARQRGYDSLLIQGDPNAERFYRVMGATRIGARESASIPGRELPLYEVALGKVDS